MRMEALQWNFMKLFKRKRCCVWEAISHHRDHPWYLELINKFYMQISQLSKKNIINLILYHIFSRARSLLFVYCLLALSHHHLHPRISHQNVNSQFTSCLQFMYSLRALTFFSRSLAFIAELQAHNGWMAEISSSFLEHKSDLS